MKKIKCVLLTLSILTLLSASGQVRLQDGMKNCLQAVYKDKKKVKKSDRNGRVSVAFFQNFSDTVTLFLNNVALYRNYIFHDTTLVSSNFTDSIASISLSGLNTDTITITYKNLNKFLKFPVSDKYVLYTIHSYMNGNCFVSARRKRVLSLK